MSLNLQDNLCGAVFTKVVYLSWLAERWHLDGWTSLVFSFFADKHVSDHPAVTFLLQPCRSSTYCWRCRRSFLGPRSNSASSLGVTSSAPCALGWAASSITSSWTWTAARSSTIASSSWTCSGYGSARVSVISNVRTPLAFESTMELSSDTVWLRHCRVLQERRLVLFDKLDLLRFRFYPCPFAGYVGAPLIPLNWLWTWSILVISALFFHTERLY